MSAVARPDETRFRSKFDGLVIDAEAPVPTKHGAFRFVVFRYARDLEHDDGEHVALVAGDPNGDDVLVSVHSECMTSEVFGSLNCDCAEQLDHALEEIGRVGRGVLVYLRRDRGIGLANEIRAYALQAGADTVDTNRALGLPDDARRYAAVAALLHSLGVRSVSLMTNSPAKVDGLDEIGIDVRRRIPIVDYG